MHTSLTRLWIIGIFFLFMGTLLHAQQFATKYHIQYQDKKKSNVSLNDNVRNEAELFTSINKTLVELYDDGYLLANVDSFSFKENIYHVFISSGRIYKWARLKEGNIDEKALNFAGFREKIFFNEPINYKNYYRLQKKLFAYYEN